MTSIDPILHHLHRRGSGSWSFFTRSIEAYDPSIDALACARALAEHALIEFDFDNDLSWSVTGVTLVDTGNAVVAWGGTARGLFNHDGLVAESGNRTLIFDGAVYSYQHAVRVRKVGREWPRGFALSSASAIRGLIPEIMTVIGAQPCDRIPQRKAQQLIIALQERVNPGGFRQRRLSGEWHSAEGIVPQRNAVWRIDRATYLVTRNHRVFWAQVDPALWYGFTEAAQRLGREHLLFCDNDTLHVAAYPRLPIPLVRALLLSGAREARSERRDRRLFKNVDLVLAEWFGNKLGLPV